MTAGVLGSNAYELLARSPFLSDQGVGPFHKE